MARREMHWWIGAVGEDGKQILIYGAPDFGPTGGEDAARSRAFEMLSGMDFTIERLPTRNLQQASSIWRGKRLAGGEGLSASMQRIGHERTANKARQRRAERGL